MKRNETGGEREDVEGQLLRFGSIPYHTIPYHTILHRSIRRMGISWMNGGKKFPRRRLDSISRIRTHASISPTRTYVLL
jgi:hypothetical protein